MDLRLRELGLLAARRLVRLALILAAVAAVAFALAKLSPIDPIEAYLGPATARLGPEQRALIAGAWGLDQPAAVQFARWAGRILAGDLGWSVTFNAPVSEVLRERMAATLLLAGSAWFLSGVLGFALGVLAGATEGSWLDRAIRVWSYCLASTPTFWLAILLLVVFSVELRWTPICCAGPIGVPPGEVTFADRLRHLMLPLATLTLVGVSQMALHTRAKMAEILRSPFALFALAQGASRLDIVLRHGLRNAGLPAVAILFASTGEILGGSVLAEQVFGYPGLGRATVEAGVRGDVPLLLAITLLTTAIVSAGNALADLLYRVLDPRIPQDRDRNGIDMP